PAAQGLLPSLRSAVLAGGLLPNLEQYATTLPGYLLQAAITGTWTGTVALIAGTLSPLALTRRLGLGNSRLGRPGWIVVPLGALGLSQAIDAAYTLSGFGRGA